MPQNTETDQELEHVDTPTPLVKLLFTSGRVAPVDPELAPVQTVAIGSAGLLLGRDASEEIGLPLPNDRRASAHHAQIFSAPDGLYIRDQSSKNGTYVNGQLVSSARLTDRAVIRIGNTILLFRYKVRASWQGSPLAAAARAQDTLLGSSPEMEELRHQLACAAERTAPVLLLGATGTGKELAARALHAQSAGPDAPLISVNCASIPGSLAESALFGYAAGAFTGARGSQPGYFQQASGGTLFLDEVGELPLEIQAKLLRALEERVIWPVGAREPVPCKLRFIAATNRDLERAISEQKFRADLLARLAVLQIHLPPLSERREDILSLFMHFLGRPTPLTARLAEALVLFPWPQNVRQLINVAENAKTFWSGQELDLPQLAPLLRSPAVSAPPAGSAAAAEPAAVSAPRVVYTEELLQRLLEENQGIISRIAKSLGLSRRQVGRVLSEHGLDAQKYRRKPGAAPDFEGDADDAEDSDAPDDEK